MSSDAARPQAPSRTIPVPHQPPLLMLAVLALCVMILVTLRREISNDGDIGWHLAAGRLIISTWHVPSVDPFSMTFTGQPWTAHEWLSEVMLAAAQAAGDWSGVALLTGAAVAGLIVLLGLEIGRWLNGSRTLIVLLLVLIVLQRFILARPHVLAWIPLALWVIILLRAREANRAPPLAAALVMLVWANMHASFIFGLLLAGAFGLEALIAAEDRARVFGRWLLFGAVALLAGAATPFGLQGLLFPFQVNNLAISSAIIEWLPTVLVEMPLFAAFLIIGLFTLLYRGVRVPVVRLLILCGIFYMAFASVRHQYLLAIVGSLIIAVPLAATFPVQAPAAPPRRGLLAAVAAAALVFGIVRLAFPEPRPETPSHPAAMIAALPPELRRQPVFNGYGLGGSLIFAGIRPFIDGRADVYGDAFALQALAITNGDRAAFERAVTRWGITWTILPPDIPLVGVLDASPDWHRLAADRYAVVHVRRQPPTARAPSPPPV